MLLIYYGKSCENIKTSLLVTVCFYLETIRASLPQIRDNLYILLGTNGGGQERGSLSARMA